MSIQDRLYEVNRIFISASANPEALYSEDAQGQIVSTLHAASAHIYKLEASLTYAVTLASLLCVDRGSVKDMLPLVEAQELLRSNV